MAKVIFEHFLDTVEKRNFWSIATVLNHVAPVPVRNWFDSLVPPNTLASVINSNINIVRQLWKHKHVLKKYQLEILFGVHGVIIPVWASTLSIKTGNI